MPEFPGLQLCEGSRTGVRLRLVVCFTTAVTHRTPNRVVLPTANLVFRYVRNQESAPA